MANGNGSAAGPVFAAIPLALGLVAALGTNGDVADTPDADEEVAAVALEFAPEEQALVTEHVFGGLPSTRNVDVRRGYIRSYLPEARIPEWVAYHVIPDYREIPERKGRYSSFRVDRDVENRVRDSEYTGLQAARGFVRGHLAPYGVMGGDRDGDGIRAPEDEDEDATIFEANLLSNVAPQHHAEFNGSGGLWFELERLVQDTWVQDEGMEVWVFAGSVLGRGEHEVVGPNHDIVVPPMFFKIVIREGLEDEPDGDLPKVLAFLFPHQRERHGDPEDFLVSVDIIEALTDLDFFNEFGQEVQSVLEDRDTSLNWDSFVPSEEPLPS